MHYIDENELINLIAAVVTTGGEEIALAYTMGRRDLLEQLVTLIEQVEGAADTTVATRIARVLHTAVTGDVVPVRDAAAAQRHARLIVRTLTESFDREPPNGTRLVAALETELAAADADVSAAVAEAAEAGDQALRERMRQLHEQAAAQRAILRDRGETMLPSPSDFTRFVDAVIVATEPS